MSSTDFIGNRRVRVRSQANDVLLDEFENATSILLRQSTGGKVRQIVEAGLVAADQVNLGKPTMNGRNVKFTARHIFVALHKEGRIDGALAKACSKELSTMLENEIDAIRKKGRSLIGSQAA